MCTHGINKTVFGLRGTEIRSVWEVHSNFYKFAISKRISNELTQFTVIAKTLAKKDVERESPTDYFGHHQIRLCHGQQCKDENDLIENNN